MKSRLRWLFAHESCPCRLNSPYVFAFLIPFTSKYSKVPNGVRVPLPLASVVKEVPENISHVVTVSSMYDRFLNVSRSPIWNYHSNSSLLKILSLLSTTPGQWHVFSSSIINISSSPSFSQCLNAVEFLWKHHLQLWRTTRSQISLHIIICYYIYQHKYNYYRTTGVYA